MFKVMRPTFPGFQTITAAHSLGGAEAILEGISLRSPDRPLMDFIVGPDGRFHASLWSVTKTDPRPTA